MAAHMHVLKQICLLAAATESAPKKVHPSPLSQAPPSTYAIIEVGGHQMFVEPGKWYTCNRLTVSVAPTEPSRRHAVFRSSNVMVPTALAG
jgi:hypothetical protein